jgi:hypothetical protein
MTYEPDNRDVLVVYESMFGNTALVAEAIADGLRGSGAEVELTAAATAPTNVDEFGLVVVGGPTHAWSMSRPRTRGAARDKGATAAPESGVREWLAVLQRPKTTVRAASFDTRMQSRFAGSAARRILRRLHRHGMRGDECFHAVVTGMGGPLADGELDRARRWSGTLIPARAHAGR